MSTRNIYRKQPARNGLQYVVTPEVRDELKPIVFFDAGKFTKTDDGFKIGYHPHSGIGIITYFHGTDLHHNDSADNPGVIHDGGAQWIRAGKGVWHEEGYARKHDDQSGNEWTGSIHQLWIQLPPEFEEGEVEYANLSEQEIPRVDNVKILTGNYKGVEGKMNVPVNMTYLDVYLTKGEKWSFETPEGQTTGFIFSRDGGLTTNDFSLQEGEMGVLDPTEGTIEVTADSENSNFIVVIAEPSTFPIVTNGGQIHTNQESLERSFKNIQEIGKSLH